jgi:hypothetical protein
MEFGNENAYKFSGNAKYRFEGNGLGARIKTDHRMMYKHSEIQSVDYTGWRPSVEIISDVGRNGRLHDGQIFRKSEL